MLKVSHESWVYGLTGPEILGKEKVISYEDLKHVRAKRAVKEKAMAGESKDKSIAEDASSTKVGETNPSVPEPIPCRA